MVIGQDKGAQPRRTQVYVDIEVIDGNDEAPVISPREYAVAVDENEDLGEQLLKVGTLGYAGRILQLTKKRV